jgi:hypothetical protein
MHGKLTVWRLSETKHADAIVFKDDFHSIGRYLNHVLRESRDCGEGHSDSEHETHHFICSLSAYFYKGGYKYIPLPALFFSQPYWQPYWYRVARRAAYMLPGRSSHPFMEAG